MSEALNDIFIDNFQKDPTLTWQYFGSATGFFRLYPGGYTESPSFQTHFSFQVCCYKVSAVFSPATTSEKIIVLLCKLSSVLTQQLAMREAVCRLILVCMCLHVRKG